MSKSVRKLKEKTIERIHEYCANKFCWHKFWDEYPRPHFVHWLIFFIFITGILISLSWISTQELLKADITTTSVTVISFPAPTDLTATVVSTTRIDLSWSSVSDAVSYKVYREGLLIASSTTTFYSDTSLSPGTSYSYTVSSVNVFGGESEQSSSISATTPGVGGGGGVYIPPRAPPPSPLSPEAQKIDTNKDDKIDLLDFNLLMVNWGATIAGNIADFNDDSIVDIFDFNLLMIHWAS